MNISSLHQIIFTMFFVKFASTKTMPVGNHSAMKFKETSSINKSVILLDPDLFSRNDDNISAEESSASKVRSKRQAGQFVDASGMPTSKILGILMQMIANPFSKVYVGAPHPLHWTVPKVAVFWLREAFEGASAASGGRKAEDDK